MQIVLHWILSIVFAIAAIALTFPVSPRFALFQAGVGALFLLVRVVRPHRNLLLVQMAAQVAVLVVGGCSR